MSALVPHVAPAAPLRLFLAGDVMTGRGIDQILPHPSDPQLYERYMSSAVDYVRLAERRNGQVPRPVGWDYVWGEARGEWMRRRPDLRIVNLETSVTASDDYEPKGINYRMSPRNVRCLTASGADCCVLANNHVLDFGRSGLAETLASLRTAGLRSVGAGRDGVEAAKPVVLRGPRGGRVIVAAFCTATSGVPEDWAAGPARAGVNLVTPTPAVASRLARALAPLREPGDLVVASIHWGANWAYEIPGAHRRLARALIDQAGVSVVHGHSSHHPLAIEVYRGRLILYGCGDFLNDYEGITGKDEYRGDLVLMYFADLERETGRLTGLEMIPLKLRRLRLERPSTEDRAWIRARLDRECRRFGGRISASRESEALSWAPG